ncbi:MAG TPA: CDP-diacylglycerol diphosphatase [Magnetospirillaceae bacterium]|jgi:CDP-diacylglycerol pyrophosphatase
MTNRLLIALATAFVAMTGSTAFAQNASGIFCTHPYNPVLLKVVTAHCKIAAKPCGESAAIKDISPVKTSRYLQIPTTPITGIEAITDDTPNYFADAWASAQTVLKPALKTDSPPRDEIGVAINSECGRSVDQMHIHIDCVDPDVWAWLRQHGNDIDEKWKPTYAYMREGDAPFPFQHYRMRWVAGQDLRDINPFHWLLHDLSAKGQTGDYTLGIVGAPAGDAGSHDGQAGFFAFVDATARHTAHAEELLTEQGCDPTAYTP